MSQRRMRCVLVDDEPKAIATLENLIELFTPQLEILQSFNNIGDAQKFIEQHEIDVLFLDVEMPRGGGFQLLESIGNPKFHVIFVTAFDHYAIKALRMSALDYLLKPVDPDDLIQAVARVQEIAGEDRSVQYENLKTGVRNGEFNKLVVPTSGGVRLIHLETIVRMESDNNYTNVHLEGEAKPLLISKTLKHFERALESSAFLRVHQSHLINATKIVDYDTEGGGVIRLSNKDEVLVSRSKRAMIRDYILGNNLGLA